MNLYLSTLLLIAIPALLALIAFFLIRYRRLWIQVRRSLRSKIDQIYEDREQLAKISEQVEEATPLLAKVGEALDGLADWKGISGRNREQLEEVLRAMDELRRLMAEVRSTLNLPEMELSEAGKDLPAGEDQEFSNRLMGILWERMGDETFDVASLASQMGMSRTKLFNRVREVTGQTPKQLLNEVRLFAADKLLAEGTMSVSEIADATGWSSVSYFSKSFKRRFGRKPKKN